MMAAITRHPLFIIIFIVFLLSITPTTSLPFTNDYFTLKSGKTVRISDIRRNTRSIPTKEESLKRNIFEFNHEKHVLESHHRRIRVPVPPEIQAHHNNTDRKFSSFTNVYHNASESEKDWFFFDNNKHLFAAIGSDMDIQNLCPRELNTCDNNIYINFVEARKITLKQNYYSNNDDSISPQTNIYISNALNRKKVSSGNESAPLYNVVLTFQNQSQTNYWDLYRKRNCEERKVGNVTWHYCRHGAVNLMGTPTVAIAKVFGPKSLKRKDVVKLATDDVIKLRPSFSKLFNNGNLRWGKSRWKERKKKGKGLWKINLLGYLPDDDTNDILGHKSIGHYRQRFPNE